jgi:hypothetical protein
MTGIDGDIAGRALQSKRRWQIALDPVAFAMDDAARIVDTDVTRQYWADPTAGCARVNVSDWKPGSRWEHQRVDDTHAVDIVGKVVESTPRGFAKRRVTTAVLRVNRRLHAVWY